MWSLDITRPEEPAPRGCLCPHQQERWHQVAPTPPSLPQSLEAGALPIWIPLKEPSPELAIVTLSLVAFGHWSLGVQEGRSKRTHTPPPRPSASTVAEASPPLQYLSFFRTTDSERTVRPTSSGSLTASLLSSHLQPRGTEKGEEAAVQLFPTYPWVRRQEGHTAALTTRTPLGIGINREGKGPWRSPHLCLFPEDLGQGAKCLLD